MARKDGLYMLSDETPKSQVTQTKVVLDNYVLTVIGRVPDSQHQHYQDSMPQLTYKLKDRLRPKIRRQKMMAT